MVGNETVVSERRTGYLPDYKKDKVAEMIRRASLGQGGSDTRVGSRDQEDTQEHTSIPPHLFHHHTTPGTQLWLLQSCGVKAVAKTEISINYSHSIFFQTVLFFVFSKMTTGDSVV